MDKRFKYVCKRSNGHTFQQIFSMKQIEFGETLKWIEANYIIEKELFKCQFIGLKDENKIEIYEEDIVRTIEQTMSHGDIEIIGVVEYDENDACYRIFFPKYGESIPLCSFIELGIEVIGNEFENPDIIENLSKENK